MIMMGSQIWWWQNWELSNLVLKTSRGCLISQIVWTPSPEFRKSSGICPTYSIYFFLFVLYFGALLWLQEILAVFICVKHVLWKVLRKVCVGSNWHFSDGVLGEWDWPVNQNELGSSSFQVRTYWFLGNTILFFYQLDSKMVLLPHAFLSPAVRCDKMCGIRQILVGGCLIKARSHMLLLMSPWQLVFLPWWMVRWPVDFIIVIIFLARSVLCGGDNTAYKTFSSIPDWKPTSPTSPAWHLVAS